MIITLEGKRTSCEDEPKFNNKGYGEQYTK